MKPLKRKLLQLAGASFLTLILLGAVGALVAYAYLMPRLPSIEALKDVRLQVPLRIYTRTGDLIAEFGEMKRSPLSFEEFPDMLVKAVLAAEDDRFFEHPGVDYQGLLRAAVNLIRTGEKGQGGSTITMQVARNFFLSREKTFLRKFNEILLALKIENELSKQQILELYLNKIYLGKRAYGFAAAAQVYYGKSLAELELSQLAMIAGLPKAPSRYNPVANRERAVLRRDYVLGRMRELDFIDEASYQAALAAEDDASVHGLAVEVEAPYIAEMARTVMLDEFGPEVYSAGYKVYTSIDPTRQAAANAALKSALLEYGRRHGYRGTAGHVEIFDADAPEDMQGWQERLEEIPAAGGLSPSLVFHVDEEAAWAYTADNRVVYMPFERLDWAAKYIDDNHQGPPPKSADEVLSEGDIVLVMSDGTGCSWLANIPEVAGALISLDPRDGAIRSLVGGFDFYQSKFNRVIQAKRQPGSSFKPFIYTAAIDKGFTAASIINDAPVVFDAPGLEDTWRPENYSGRFYGPTRLRKALVNSRNLVSIRLLRDIGIGYAVRYARRFGFPPGDLPRDLSLALGSGSVTPLEVAGGYSVFANGGYQVTPYFIDYVVGPDDDVVARTLPARVCPECELASSPAVEASDKSASPPATGSSTTEAAASADPNVPGSGASAEAVPDQPGPNALSEAQPDAQQVNQVVLQDINLYPQLNPGALLKLPFDPLAEDETSLPQLVLDETQLAAGEAALPGVSESAQADDTVTPVPPMFLPAKQVLSPQTCFLTNTMLRDVIRFGTGRRALQLGRNDLAGKTGTTNDQQDAWFAGFTSETVTITWVGFDNPRPLGEKETGARAALPMWMAYMQEALKTEPQHNLVQPPGIVSVRIDAETGLLAGPQSSETLFEYFPADQVPQEKAPVAQAPQGGEESSGDITEQLF